MSRGSNHGEGKRQQWYNADGNVDMVQRMSAADNYQYMSVPGNCLPVKTSLSLERLPAPQSSPAAPERRLHACPSCVGGSWIVRALEAWCTVDSVEIVVALVVARRGR